jgi:MFS family permease
MVPQVVTAAIAVWVARRGDGWGRKALLLAAFGVLPIRAILFTVAPSPLYLLAVQVLGGLTAAVIAMLAPLVIADVSAVAGVTISTRCGRHRNWRRSRDKPCASGFVAQSFGYTIGFGGCGVALILLLLPETKPVEFGATR